MRVVASDVRTVRFNTIAALRVVRISLLLRPILGGGETTDLLARLGDPADHGDGSNGARARGPAEFHHLVEFRIVRKVPGAGRREVFVVPVARGVVGIEQPVVTSGQVPAPAAHR